MDMSEKYNSDRTGTEASPYPESEMQAMGIPSVLRDVVR
jgi:hypothetical protein